MGARRIIWHIGMGWNLRRHGPKNIDIIPEFALAEEALRIDFMLIRKTVEGPMDDAKTLRKLWPLLPKFTVFEFKSHKKSFRKGDLDKLWGYTHLFISDARNNVIRRDDLCAVLTVPHRTPTLDDAILEANLTWENLGDGYFRVHGGQFVLYVIESDVAGLAEHDGILYGLGTGKFLTKEARRFLMELSKSKEIQMNADNIEDFDELEKEYLAALPPHLRLAGLAPEQRLAGLAPEQRLAGLAPEQRLEGLAPEQRLEGLDHDQQALALPLDVLRYMPKEYFESLSPNVRTILEARLAKP
jgi:hypothetical protein